MVTFGLCTTALITIGLGMAEVESVALPTTGIILEVNSKITDVVMVKSKLTTVLAVNSKLHKGS